MARFRCPQCGSPMNPSAEDGRLLSPILCDRCAGRKMLPPDAVFTGRLPRFRVRFITIFFVTTAFCIFLATIRAFGLVGVAVAADLAVVVFGIANLSGIRSALGVQIPRVTMAELTMLLLFCLILHGLCMPAVSSHR